MNHEVKEQDNNLIIIFSGDIDLQTSPEVRKILMENVDKEKSILVDLSGVGYIDSSGVASLVEALQTVRKNGKQLALIAVSEGAMRVFQLARLDKVFAIYATLNEGIKEISGG